MHSSHYTLIDICAHSYRTENLSKSHTVKIEDRITKEPKLDMPKIPNQMIRRGSSSSAKNSTFQKSLTQFKTLEKSLEYKKPSYVRSTSSYSNPNICLPEVQSL